MKTTPKITEENAYDEQSLMRVVIHFCRTSPVQCPLEYMFGVYEVFYPFFSYREHAEQAFEELMNIAVNEGVSIGHMVTVTIGMIDDFKHRRFME